MNLSRVRSDPVASHSGTRPLALEACPEPVQVMPPITRRWPLALAVLGNVLVGLLLLGGLLLTPALVSALLLP